MRLPCGQSMQALLARPASIRKPRARARHIPTRMVVAAALVQRARRAGRFALLLPNFVGRFPDVVGRFETLPAFGEACAWSGSVALYSPAGWSNADELPSAPVGATFTRFCAPSGTSARVA